MICTENEKLYCNDKKRNEARTAVGFVQSYAEKTEGMKKSGALVMCLTNAVAQNTCSEFRKNLFYNGIHL